MSKAVVTLGGVPLSAELPIVWRIQTGTQPYTTTLEVHEDDWPRIERMMGSPQLLLCVDARGVETKIESVYPLHVVAGSGPHRRAFLVSDKRWKWSYKLIARDYNMTKKSGDRDADDREIPVEKEVVVDKYDFKPYSLRRDGTKWAPRQAVEDVLEILEPDVGGSGRGWMVESFPLGLETSEEGAYTMQNVTLRDSGDVALARLMSFVPGAELYVDFDGMTRVFDASDLNAADRFIDQTLPAATYDGDSIAHIDRTKIRPNRVVLHYEREIEAVFEYADNYNGQTTTPDRKANYLENVMPTVDTSTEVEMFDPESNSWKTTTVPQGTWCRADKLLEAWDADKPAGSRPWTFATFRIWWHGPLESMLGGIASAGILDLDPAGNVAARVQMVRQHLWQTFRINRRYMERVRSIEAVRAGLLDPVTATRAPASVWGQICVIPTQKGKMSQRKNPQRGGFWRNMDFIPASGTNLRKYEPAPGRVNILDRDLGIFRVEYINSPYGTVQSITPRHTINANGGDLGVPMRNLEDQDVSPTGTIMRIEGTTNSIVLRPTMELRVMLTIIPGAPNNKNRYHKQVVEAFEISPLFARGFGIEAGQGPDLEVFIPPTEASVRFQWDDDSDAQSTIVDLLGLDSDDPNEAGIEDDPDTTRNEAKYLKGFTWINEQREIPGHAKAVAAELLANYADSSQGRLSTIMPTTGRLVMRGNMTSAAIQIGAAPSGKVSATYDFPGQQKPISRLALMPENARQVVLGIVKLGGTD